MSKTLAKTTVNGVTLSLRVTERVNGNSYSLRFYNGASSEQPGRVHESTLPATSESEAREAFESESKNL